jgi:hypothetical protein
VSSGHLVHLAGPSIRVGPVVRQRCAWCGAVIDEWNLDRLAWPEGMDPGIVDADGNPQARWEGLVAVESHGERAILGTVAKWKVEDPDDGGIPPDSCMELPAEATA